ncbi:hypothetical protein SLA2020_091450 [Shorea laevis]
MAMMQDLCPIPQPSNCLPHFSIKESPHLPESISPLQSSQPPLHSIPNPESTQPSAPSLLHSESLQPSPPSPLYLESLQPPPPSSPNLESPQPTPQHPPLTMVDPNLNNLFPMLLSRICNGKMPYFHFALHLP